MADFLDILGQIPEWFGSAVTAALGWFSHVGYTAWQKSRLPFKEDKKRFELTIEAVNTKSLYYFNSWDPSAIPQHVFDGLFDTEYKLTPQARPVAFLNKKLKEKEETFINALQHFNSYISTHTFKHRNNSQVSTIYVDNFDEWNDEHQRKAQEIIDEIVRLKSAAISSFEEYRDFGNKMFAEKVS